MLDVSSATAGLSSAAAGAFVGADLAAAGLTAVGLAAAEAAGVAGAGLAAAAPFSARAAAKISATLIPAGLFGAPPLAGLGAAGLAGAAAVSSAAPADSAFGPFAGAGGGEPPPGASALRQAAKISSTDIFFLSAISSGPSSPPELFRKTNAATANEINTYDKRPGDPPSLVTNFTNSYVLCSGVRSNVNAIWASILGQEPARRPS